MRPPGHLVLCLLSLAPAIHAATAQEAAATPNATRAITELIKSVESANNVGDAERWVSFFDDDFVYMAPGAPPVTDREELVRVARAGFRNDADIRIEPDEIRVCGDWAYARSHVTGSVKLVDSGREVPIDVKQLVIYRRDAAGAWRISRLMGNSNLE